MLVAVATTAARNQEESMFQFAHDYAGVVLFLLVCVGGLCLWLLAEREAARKALIAERERAHQTRIKVLEDLVRQQANSMAEAVDQMRVITDVLHARVTELSEAFHKLKGEHDSKMATCPLNNANGLCHTAIDVSNA